MAEKQIPFGAQVFRHLDTNGDGSGSIDGNVAGARTLFIQPPAGTVFLLHRILVTIRDSGVWTADGYGSGAALGTGVRCYLAQDGVEKLDLMDGESVKTNGGWGGICYDVDLKSWGNGDSFLVVRWTFSKAGIPVMLDGRTKDQLVISLADDLSGLDGHRFFVQGFQPAGV